MTNYGNTVKWEDGRAYDIDMGVEVSSEVVDFRKYVGNLEDY